MDAVTQSAPELTPMQERTLHGLIGVGEAPAFDAALVGRVRGELDEAMRHLSGTGSDALWLGKHRLNDHQRCHGLFDAGLKREGGDFEHSARTAAGALFHGAIEVDVATERRFDPRSVGERAARQRARVDRSFGRYWSTLDEFERADLVAESARHLTLFRDSFPPLPRRWAAQTELPVRIRLVKGVVVLSGTPDLVLGVHHRLVIDFKTGRALPEHPEDMRFYALLLLLRTGIPPYRVATFFLDSGEWQAEDVTERTIEHAAARVIAAAETAARLADHPAELTPGPYCRWCPRSGGCPQSTAREATTPGVRGLPEPPG
jgi:hypothetical protein